MTIKRKPDETEIEYKYRICKDREIYDLDTWNDVAEALNKELDADFTESAYRKWYKNFEAGVQHGIESASNQDMFKEIEDKTITFQKEKVKLQDQKRELSNLIRQQARFEHLKDEVVLAIKELNKDKPLSFIKSDYPKLGSEKKGIALWSDWHIGSEFSNSFNTYSIDVFRSRLKHLVSKTVEYSSKNNIGEIIIANLGDALHGAIHVSARVQSGEDVIRQIQIAAEAMSEALAELSKHHNKIKFINIIGNHSRLISNKNDSVFTENLEYLIPWFMNARLKDFSNIEIVQDTDGYYIEEIDGEKFVFCHGDLDSANMSAKNIPQLLGFVPKVIFSAHIHHNFEKEFGRTETIVNGSMMGPDDYSVSKRYYASPMQKYIVLDGNEIECTYKIKFNK